MYITYFVSYLNIFNNYLILKRQGPNPFEEPDDSNPFKEEMKKDVETPNSDTSGSEKVYIIIIMIFSSRTLDL